MRRPVAMILQLRDPVAIVLETPKYLGMCDCLQLTAIQTRARLYEGQAALLVEHCRITSLSNDVPVPGSPGRSM